MRERPRIKLTSKLMFLALQRFPTARLPGQGKGTHHLCPPGAGPHLPATRTAPPFPGKRTFSVDALATEPRGLRPRREWRKKPSSAPSHRGRGRERAQQRPPPHLPAPATRATTIAQQAPLPPAGVSSPRPDPRPGRDRPTRPGSARLSLPLLSHCHCITFQPARHSRLPAGKRKPPEPLLPTVLPPPTVTSPTNRPPHRPQRREKGSYASSEPRPDPCPSQHAAPAEGR